ncbi:LolA-like outer membrane lipoprotein chaperone [Campylobacter upsaliensis]|nr:outer membrane lipoprotein chaperone LolA [Campylobacter upsaliensis]EIO6376145.1 outer membrane lipoprotein chaperone LolA [Campylobacter upsaliensis]EJB7517242.1 outer membrane lipoprotein chaperone LolA [Campylobacter upsaliensis]EJW3047426.1 outer membrane lipoprotein chaperone LolA [Campylobacter upsaliensis]
MKFFILLSLIYGFVFAYDLNYENYTSKFTQSVSSKNSQFDYKGHFVLEKDRAFWSYESPSKKEIYINKNEIVIVEHDLEQVSFARLEKIPNLNAIFKQAKEITPNKLKANYENVDYFITLFNDEVKSIQYTDEFENKVLITLHKPQKNTKINSQIFKPKFPQNYDILR